MRFGLREKREQGFSLVELMIAVAIIVILSGIALASFSGARSQTRDTRRISDITQIQTALESYFEAQPANARVYPAGTAALVSGGYIGTLPTDPSTNTAYDYFLDTTGDSSVNPNQGYCLGANLENASNTSIAQNVSCNGISWCPLVNGGTVGGQTYPKDNYVVCRE